MNFIAQLLIVITSFCFKVDHGYYLCQKVFHLWFNIDSSHSRYTIQKEKFKFKKKLK